MKLHRRLIRESFADLLRDFMGESANGIELPPRVQRHTDVQSSRSRRHWKGLQPQSLEHIAQGQGHLPDGSKIIVRRIEIENQHVR